MVGEATPLIGIIAIPPIPQVYPTQPRDSGYCTPLVYPILDTYGICLDLFGYLECFEIRRDYVSCTLDRIRTCGLRIRNPLLNSFFVVKEVVAIIWIAPNYGTEFCIGLIAFESVWLFEVVY